MRTPACAVLLLLACASQRPATPSASIPTEAREGAAQDARHDHAAARRRTEPESDVPALPHGDRVTLRRNPCYGTCPSFEVSIDSEGTVFWIGHDHVSRLGPARAALSPDRVRQIFDAWRSLDHDALPATPGEAACGTDGSIDALTVVLGGEVTTRRLGAMYGFLCWNPDLGEEACERSKRRWASRGIDYQQLEALDDLMQEIESIPAIEDWIASEKCRAAIFPERPQALMFLPPSAIPSFRMMPAYRVAEQLEAHPDWVVRVRGYEEAPGKMQEATAFYLAAIRELGLDESRVIVSTVPLEQDPPTAVFLAGGRFEVGPRSCLPAPR